MTTEEGVLEMSGGISIRPSKDLRNNYAQISQLSRVNPVAITVNGKEDTVVLCHEDYVQQQKLIAELEAKLSVYAHLAQAADDIKLGRVQNADDVFDDMFRELDDLVL
jgi:PHD/YefM family antitoxin component YafN of YafNO toxin-antitoxin module